MKKQTILIFTHDYPINRGDSAFISNEIGFIASKFNEVVIYCFSQETEDKIPTPTNCKVYYHDKGSIIQLIRTEIISLRRIKNIRMLFEEYRDIGFKKNGLKKWIASTKYFFRAINIRNNIEGLFEKDDKPNIVYSFWADVEALASILLNFDSIICTRAHGYDLYKERNVLHYQAFKRVIDRRINSVFFICRQGMRYYLNQYATNHHAKYAVFYLGTARIFNNVRLYDLGYKFRLLSISSAVSIKRLDRIIHALERVDSSICIEWTHIGGGELLSDMENLAISILGSKKNISWVFTGGMTHEQVIQYLMERDFHVLINSSESEGVPVSMMEALSCSIPIIGPDIGGVGELIDKQNGILLSPTATPDDYARSIEKIAKMKNDEYEKLRINAFLKWESRFDSSKNADLFAEKLCELSK